MKLGVKTCNVFAKHGFQIWTALFVL